MDRRRLNAWPMWAPRRFEVTKPTSEYIRDWAAMTPEKTALSFYGYDISYENLNRMIDKAAWGIVGLGLRKGDRVAVHMQNCPQFVMAYLGTQRAGGIVVPVNPMFKQVELEHELNDADARILFTLDFLYPEVQKIRDKTPLTHVILASLADYLPSEPILPLPPEAKEDRRPFPDTLLFTEIIGSSRDDPICRVASLKKDLALLQYTGGTTGTPKGAMIDHYALARASLGAAYWYRHRENDVFLGVTPFFHVMGQQQLMTTPLLSGGRVVILARWAPDAVAAAIDHYRCTYWVGPTTSVISLLNFPGIGDYDLASLRCITTGGAAISVELQNQLKELVPNAAIVEGYGLSETLSQGGAITPLYRYKPGFVGVPQLNRIKIMDTETGTREMEPNEEGEIWVKGTTVMRGYWNKPEETAEVLRDGWLHTGDIGLMDEDGYIKLLGRMRELIKCSGFSVFPGEVEELLYRHPAVKEVAVIGISDPYRGESPKAIIVLKPDCADKVTEEQIRDWCKENMAAYKRPRVIEFRQELPKSAAGKILKRLLA
jgi:acyl-CoA synthetase (AMP-forming)/AMP-acid ligase II